MILAATAQSLAFQKVVSYNQDMNLWQYFLVALWQVLEFGIHNTSLKTDRLFVYTHLWSCQILDNIVWSSISSETVNLCQSGDKWKMANI